MIQPTLIYISFGSNILPENNTRTAISTIKKSLTDCQVSTVYRCPAVGMDGDDFLNGVIGGFTSYSLNETRQWLRDIECQQGRIRTDNKYADRPIDLDLLLYGDVVTEGLPHHEIENQAYVLQPLTDIAATLAHPTLSKSISDLNARLLQQCPQQYAALTPVILDFV